MDLIRANYATHNHADVQTRLHRHGRFHLHFTATSSSWRDLVERRFRELTPTALRRGILSTVPDVIGDIEYYFDANNHDWEPLDWTATAVSILDKFRQRPRDDRTSR